MPRPKAACFTRKWARACKVTDRLIKRRAVERKPGEPKHRNRTKAARKAYKFVGLNARDTNGHYGWVNFWRGEYNTLGGKLQPQAARKHKFPAVSTWPNQDIKSRVKWFRLPKVKRKQVKNATKTNF